MKYLIQVLAADEGSCVGIANNGYACGKRKMRIALYCA